MKRTISVLAVLSVLALAVVAPAEQGQTGQTGQAGQTGKIGYVDLQRAMNTSEHGMNVKLELEGMVKEKTQMVEKLARERDTMQQDLEKNRMVMSEAAVRDKLDQIKKIDRTAERMIEESNEELGKVQRDKEVGILKDLDAIITEIGMDGEYTVIIPAEMVLYAPESLNITDEVIKRYNASKGLKPSKE